MHAPIAIEEPKLLPFGVGWFGAGDVEVNGIQGFAGGDEEGLIVVSAESIIGGWLRSLDELELLAAGIDDGDAGFSGGIDVVADVDGPAIPSLGLCLRCSSFVI